MISMSEPSEFVEAVEVAEVAAPVNISVDQAVLSARALAREALEEITDAATIGADDGYEAHDERTATLYFECTMAGYPGWRWAAALTRVDDESPVTVLEVEMLPGEGAVLAPEWVPWSERLAQYREAQASQASDEAFAAEEAAEELADEDDSDDDVMENDYSDFDDDFDGVDLEDELDEDSDDDSDDSDDDDESDDDDDSDDDDSDDEDEDD